MAEVRNAREGSLVWVQASASANPGWTTASAPVSGVFAYVRSFSFTSAMTTQQVMERGKPNHNKIVEESPVQLSFTVAWTGYLPTATTANGGTVPEVHLEFKQDQAELGASFTGQYFQFYRVPLQSLVMTENPDENTLAFTTQALGMLATASGYLGNHIV